MFASVLDQVTSQLGKRFLLNAFFPTLLFFMLLGLAVIASGPGIDTAIEWWEEQPAIVLVVTTTGGVATVFVVANVLAGSMLWVIGLFEGWGLPKRIKESGQRYEYNRWSEKSTKEKREMRKVFPENPASSDKVAATRLGNILLSAERYPEARYHVDAVKTWPRLYPLLPEELRAVLEEARSSMELLLVVAFWSAAFSVLGSLALVGLGSSPGWMLVALGGGAATSAIAYRGALGPAKIYGNLIRTAYDLHRHKLIEALRLPRPATRGEERLVWPALIRFLDGDDPEYSWRYVVSE